MAKRGWPLLSCRLVVLVGIAVRSYDVSAAPCTFVTSNDGVEAECSHRRMTKFPASLANKIQSLDISSNFLTSLDGLADRRLANLRHLDVSHNLLTALPADVFRHVPHLQVLNLGHNALVTLNDDVFRGLNNLTSFVLTNTSLLSLSPTVLSHVTMLVSLDLSSNALGSVPTAALQHASRLERLDLSSTALRTVHNYSLIHLHNLRHLALHGNRRLSGLQPAAFSGLHKLVTLDLSHNQLELSNVTYPPGVFSPLVALQTLFLNDNDVRHYGDYPLNVFDPLVSLRVLSIDTFSEPHFGPAFASLISLRVLTLQSEGCHMKLVGNDTFSAFHHSGLRTLTIHNCLLLRLDSCAFCRLPQLTSLRVNGQHNFHLSHALLALYGLQNQTLQLVDFSNNRRRTLPTIVDQTNALYLHNVCVEKLDLQESGIVGVSTAILKPHSRFLSCLKHLDLSGNAIATGAVSLYLKLFSWLTNIESVKLDNQKAFRLGEDTRPDDKSPQSDVIVHVNLPGSLKSLNLSRGIKDLSQLPRHVDFPRSVNLSVLDLSYCGAYACDLSITGLTSIHTLDVSGNTCRVLGNKVLRHMTTLRRLRVADTLLQQEFLFTNGTELLRPLAELEELDLGRNALRDLPDLLLLHLPRLQRLVLAHNHFQEVPVDMSSLVALSELDLSNNLIHILPLSQRHALDRLAATNTLTLRLRGNPLTCTCQGLDMVRWLTQTVVRLDGDNRNEGYDDDYDDNGRDYPCVLEDGSMSSTVSVMAQWESHWRRCMGLAFLTVSAVALLVQLLALVLTYVLWSKWTYVRHAWRVLRHLRLPHRNDFLHDALFVYADDDLELAIKVKQRVQRVAPRLRLALTEEQIVPGSFYAEEMAKCIEQSWKVVVLVTQTFLQDDWSGFTVLQAQGSISDTLPHRVLLLYLGPLRPAHLRGPTHVSMERLLRMVPESSVYHVPRDATPRHPLWAALAHDIARDTG